jgi:peptidoglycan/xylan/chitin deacetylase (PgdA/CDA1 family)
MGAGRSAVLRRIGSGAAALPASLALIHLAPAVAGARPVRGHLFPGLAGVGARDHLALTFAGGLDPDSTPPLLDVLERAAITATFFVLGERLGRYPRLARALVDRGHEVAVQGWRQEAAWLPRPRATFDGLRDTVTAIIEVCGVRPVWYRPPRGVLTTTRLLAARRAALHPVLGTAPYHEGRRPHDAAALAARVSHSLIGGAALLLPDEPASRRTVVGALPAVFEACHDHALDVGPLREHGLWWR